MSLASGLTDRILIWVLVCVVPREAVDEALNAAGRQARRRDGKLPPYLVVYLVMALALFAGDSYEKVAALLTGSPPRRRGDGQQGGPTSGGITQARQRLGPEPLEFLFRKVGQPVSSQADSGAYLRRWRLMAADGFELEVPATPENLTAFGGADPAGQTGPRIRVLVVSECASSANVDAQLGPGAGIGADGWHALAGALYQRLSPGWLLIADPCFGGWAGWLAGSAAGAALLWRAPPDLELPVLRSLHDGSYLSLLTDPDASERERDELAGAGGVSGVPGTARVLVRVVEYSPPGAGPEQQPTVLITTIADPADAAALELALAYQRYRDDQFAGAWLSEPLSSPATVLRSKGPGLVRQEVFGRLLARYALAVLSWRAAAGVGIAADRLPAIRLVRR